MAPFLPYFHPAMATVALLLSWVVFRQGFHQRTQRLRRVPAPAGSYARHVKLGPWNVGLLVASAVGGVASSVAVRGWAPLATLHGKLGVVSAGLFVLMWWWGRALTSGDKSVANRHGVLGVFSLFVAGFTGVLGISLLP